MSRVRCIQSFLSPIRYCVNIQDEDISDNKQKLLQAIDQRSNEILKPEKMMKVLENQGFEIVTK